MGLDKPVSIFASEFKSRKWDELTEGRDFAQSDSPTLELLCQWHAIVARCMDDMDASGDVRVAYMNDMGDLKAMPQVGMLKQASAEIRALNKQLGINDEPEKKPSGARKETALYVIQANREKRVARASRPA
ncbi:P27 family phage terminase small subunit [Gordonibacter massiliensis (ex Traore et al. 2017)]|uniref:P27 family phage terminase small subunit n=1 Tax=Gordonibacter massiliensis (ex Traore et al. 2017) TaxID=1841863 RepID=UPI001C8B78C4|nr:P27 family phage terminase small subunit [Gordonibacter massiliensis (ex Traore et al. 2017)]MBX9035042.1 P27 family phage terminase small subunit [Gordonibacter massiliensis (ex Traore et al. 2017)]